MVADDLGGDFKRNGRGWRGERTGYKAHHYWLPARQRTKKLSGAWRPTLAKPGMYRIEVRIPKRHSTTRRAVYRVKTSSGWVTRRRNQARNRGSWVGLGTHQLTATPIVKLADKTGETGSARRRLAFDAVRFIPVAKASGNSAEPRREIDPSPNPTPSPGPSDDGAAADEIRAAD